MSIQSEYLPTVSACNRVIVRFGMRTSAFPLPNNLSAVSQQLLLMATQLLDPTPHGIIQE